MNEEFYGNLQCVCEKCGQPVQMVVTKKDVLFGKIVQKMTIMSIDCENCGFKDTEVKMRKQFMDYGKVITLIVSDPKHLQRRVFKSNTAGFKFAELGFDMADGSMGAHYLSVQSLIGELINQLETRSPYGGGKGRFAKQHNEFIAKLKSFQSGQAPFTMIIKDIAGSSFVESLEGEDEHAFEKDDAVIIETFKRNQEQEEELGIDEMDLQEGDGDDENDGKKVTKDQEEEEQIGKR